MMPTIFNIDADVIFLFAIIALDFIKIYQMERKIKKRGGGVINPQTEGDNI